MEDYDIEPEPDEEVEFLSTGAAEPPVQPTYTDLMDAGLEAFAESFQPAEPPIVFRRAEPVPVVEALRPPRQPGLSIEPHVMLEIMQFKRACREVTMIHGNPVREPNIDSVQFQCRPEQTEDVISHHGHVVYDTRYLNPSDSPVYVEMQNAEMWNRIAVGRVRLMRATTQVGPIDGMYYWNLNQDTITRIGDACPETEGTVVERLAAA